MSTTIKTIKEWFEELPPGYRELALKNVTDPDKVRTNLPDAIFAGFKWVATPEGYYFWSDVMKHYQGRKPSLPLFPRDAFSCELPTKMIVLTPQSDLFQEMVGALKESLVEHQHVRDFLTSDNDSGSWREDTERVIGRIEKVLAIVDPQPATPPPGGGVDGGPSLPP